MKSTWKKSIKTLWGSLLLWMAVMMLAPSIQSEAAVQKPKCASKHTMYFNVLPSLTEGGSQSYEITQGTESIFIKNLSETAKITNMKSSNKKFQVYSGLEVGQGYKFKGVFLWTKSKIKNGETTKVSFTVKQNKKTYKLSCKVTFRKESSVASFKLGKKEYSKKLNGHRWIADAKAPNKKVKVSVKLKKGYKIVNICLNGKEIKNGSTVKIAKGDYISVSYTTRKKPANYSAPLGWSEEEGYYWCDLIQISFAR